MLREADIRSTELARMTSARSGRVASLFTVMVLETSFENEAETARSVGLTHLTGATLPQAGSARLAVTPSYQILEENCTRVATECHEPLAPYDSVPPQNIDVFLNFA
jgi:hypothetical protein